MNFHSNMTYGLDSKLKVVSNKQLPQRTELLALYVIYRDLGFVSLIIKPSEIQKELNKQNNLKMEQKNTKTQKEKI